ncbi:MAG: hypothetical protein ACI9TY_000122 [Alphaproteobacteria bacterium]|jgi:hypothetical protein
MTDSRKLSLNDLNHDVNIILMYDMAKMEEASDEADEILNLIHGELEGAADALGMFCHIDNESELENQAGCYIYQCRFEYPSNFTGNDIEHERIEYLQSIAECYAKMKNIDLFNKKGITFSIDAAAHNKAQFDLYVLESEQELAEQPAEKPRYTGDTRLSVVLNNQELRHENGSDTEMERVRVMLTSFVKQFAYEHMTGFCDYTLITEANEYEESLHIYLTCPQNVSQKAFFVGVKSLVNALRAQVNEVTYAAYTKVDVKRVYEKLYNNIHIHNTTQ